VFRTSFPRLLSFALLLGCAGATYAQSGTGSIHGTVTDPTGALVPAAQIAVSNNAGFAKSLQSGADGTFSVSDLTPGQYSLAVTASGFADANLANVLVGAGKAVVENIKLTLPMEQQQVQVSAQNLAVDTSADNNASAIVIKGKDLDALSDDPDELQNELNALAGPSAGPNGGQIYVDGFTGGQLPPKSSIREIRINQNPFSAQYDKLGYGRIEILTKPGTDKFHGSFAIMGNDSAFNSLNPFVTEEPPYYTTFFMGNASGSLNRGASWFASVFDRNNQSNAIINATLLDSSGSQYSYTAAVANPQSRLDVSPRFDFQLGTNNTLTVRYMFDRQKDTNDGVSQFALESQAYNLSSYENTIQLSDTQILSANTINELRFQYMRDRSSQIAQNSSSTITVSGAFTGGGNNEGTIRDNQDRYELQDYVSSAQGRHALNFGTRLRLTHDVNYSTAGFNGNYIYSASSTYASALAAYAANAPSEYDVTTGKPETRVNLFDVGVFFQDDYKARPNLTLSYGLRYEAQNRIGDYSNWGPRFSFAWAPGSNSKKQSKTVIRGGYGWFYDRFGSSYVLEAIRRNGVNQQQYVTKYTGTNQSSPAPTVYQVSPNLKASLNMQVALGVEHQFGKIATGSVTYLNSRGVHQYLSDNINAFLPGTYDSTTGTGTRPNGVNENIYQFQSGGVYNQNQIIFNYSVHAKQVSLFGFYMMNFAKADTSGATYFPSNQTNPGADYGRSSFDVRNRFLLGGNIQAPYGVSISPMMVANSGQPFNITLSQDLNGDNQYNDRPAFATSSTADSIQTKYGTFDSNPTWDQARIPYNYGTGPSEFSVNMRVSKSFGIGPRVTSGSAATSGGGPGGPGGPPPGGGPGGGGPGGGLGPGGLSRSGGPPRMDQTAARRYSLNFAVMSRNVLNHVSLGAPVGVLDSAKFGESTSLAGGFFSSAAANRSIDLQLSFNF
jgi:hypothetical protein